MGAAMNTSRLALPALLPALLALAVAAAFPASAPCRAADSAVPAELAQLTELSIEQLLDVQVYSASKRAQRASDAPASVTVLTAEDFKTYGWRTLADALHSVRGFFLTYDRAYTFAGIRGFQRPGDYNSRILMLIDGYRINDNLYDAGYYGTEFPIDVDLIERVEIVRGPSSSVYGGNAFFGVINIVTKSAADIKGAEVSASAGSFDFYRGRAALGKQFSNGAQLLLAASQSENDGPTLRFPDDPVTAGAPISGTDYDDHYRVFGKFISGGLRLSVAHAERDKGVTGGLYATLIDPQNLTRDTISFIDATYARNIGEVELTGRLAYSEYTYHGEYVYTPGLVQADIGKGDWWIAELKGVTSLGTRHKLVAGIEYQANTRQDQSNFDIDPFFPYLDDRRDSTRVGVFAQDDYALLDNLTLSAGIRYDGYSEGDGQVNPRLGAIYRQTPTTVWKLLYGTAFRPANAYESYYIYPGLQSANPDLKPEEIKTYELVLETAPRENLRLTAAAFHYRIDNLIEFGPDPGDPTLQQFQNLSKAKASGIELEIERSFSGSARLRASYSYARTEDGTGAELTNSPRHLAKLNASLPLLERVRIGWETRYVSGRKAKLSDIGGYSVSNLTVGTHKPWRGWDVSASVYNIFDRIYSDPADLDLTSGRELLEQDGRNWRLKATYRF